MADNTVTVPNQQQETAETEAAKKRKGSQRLDCYAWVTPTKATVFSLPEKVVNYFKIDRTGEGLSGEAKLYQPKTKTKAKNDKRKIEGGSLKKNGRMILKYITLPATDATKLIPSAKEGGKARKQARIRVPSYMSINAICVWINNQFKENKPTYFTTQGGTKVFINKDYKDKAKLNEIGAK